MKRVNHLDFITQSDHLKIDLTGQFLDLLDNRRDVFERPHGRSEPEADDLRRRLLVDRQLQFHLDAFFEDQRKLATLGCRALLGCHVYDTAMLSEKSLVQREESVFTDLFQKTFVVNAGDMGLLLVDLFDNLIGHTIQRSVGRLKHHGDQEQYFRHRQQGISPIIRISASGIACRRNYGACTIRRNPFLQADRLPSVSINNRRLQ